MAIARGTASHLVVGSGGWRRWVFSFVLLGVTIAATFVLVTSFFDGDTFLKRLEAAYRVVWEHTTRRQFTDIMRERPWLLIVPGTSIIFVSGLLLPLRQWSQAVLVYVAFGIGVVFGHVFW